MKIVLLTLIGVGTATFCIAQVPRTVAHQTLTKQAADSSTAQCFLGKDCLRVSKIPPKACLVAKDSKATDACAIDGMKLINRFEIVEHRA